MVQNWLSVEDREWRVFLAVSLLFGTLFVSPFVIPFQVRVIVEHADVSRMLGGVWSVITGVATLASCALAVRKYRGETADGADTSGSAGPDTEIHIDGVEGDFNLVLGEDGRIGGYGSGEEERSTEEEAGTRSED